jgi:HD superfamily phosphodiesterase
MNYRSAKQFILETLEQKLNPHLTYHGVHHTLDVLRTTSELCTKEGIDAHHTTLLKTAALYHDCGFTVSNVEHEKQGCEIVRAHLPDFGYAATDIELICGMIMATKIPQSPQNHLEQILCDADLDYLGRSDFYSIGQTLFEELTYFKIINNEQDWNRIQVRFLEAHHFFTPTNVAFRDPNKQAHLKQLKDLVATYV